MEGGYPQYHTAKTAQVLKIIPASWGGYSLLHHKKNSTGIKNHTRIVGGGYSSLHHKKNSAGIKNHTCALFSLSERLKGITRQFSVHHSCRIALRRWKLKEFREFKEIREIREIKEFSEVKEIKERRAFQRRASPP